MRLQALDCPLAQRHSRLRRKIHRHKLPAQKFRKGRSRDHGRIVSRKRARRKENRKPLHPRLALKRGPQFPISRNSSTYEETSNVILARRRQRLHDQIVDHGPLERSHQVKRLPVAESANVFERRIVDAPESLPPSLNRRLQVHRLNVAQDRRLNSAVRKIEVRPVFFGRPLRMTAKLMIATVRMLDLRNLELDRVRMAMRRKPVNNGSSRIAQPQKLSDLIERLP